MKRFAYILTIVVGCLILTLGSLLLLVRSSKVQTAMLSVLTQELSRGVQAEVSVEHFDFHFFDELELTGIYVSDQQKDTLLYIDTLSGHFSLKGLFQNRIVFRRANLSNALVNAYTLPNGQMNFAFLTNLLPQERPEMQALIKVDKVAVERLRVRYNDIVAQEVNLQCQIGQISKDTIDAQLQHLSGTVYRLDSLQATRSRIPYPSLKDGKSLRLDDLQTKVLFYPQTGLQVPYLTLEMPHSTAQIKDLCAQFPVGGLQKETLNATAVHLDIENIQIAPADVSLFVPALHSFNGIIRVSGTIDGKVGDLQGQNLQIDYAQYPLLRADIGIQGLPVLDSTFVHAQVTDLTLHKALVQDLLADLKNEPYQLPAPVAALGIAHYKGLLQGYLDSLTLDGAFATRLGTIGTHGTLRTANRWQDMDFTGRITTHRFQLGKVVGYKDLGALSLRCEVQAKMGKSTPLKANLCARLPLLEFKNYAYHDGHLDGVYHNGRFTGEMAMRDSCLNFDFDGTVNLLAQKPVMDFAFQLHNLDLGATHLVPRFEKANLRAGLRINLEGNHLDNLNGSVQIDTLRFANGDKSWGMESFRFAASTDETRNSSLKIQSDILNANLSGQYRYSTLLTSLVRLALQYVPHGFNEKIRRQAKQTVPNNEMEFYAYFNDLDSLCNVLDLPLALPDRPIVKAFLNEPNSQFGLAMTVPEVQLKNFDIDDIALNLDNRANQINLSLQLIKRMSDRPGADKLGDLHARLTTTLRADSAYIDLGFSSSSKRKNEGHVRAVTSFTQYAGEPLIDCHLLPTTLTLADSVWTLSDSHIHYSMADTTLTVNHFRFGNEDHSVSLHGVGSTRQTDSIKALIHDLSLGYILRYTPVEDVMSFDGNITGWAVLYGLFKDPMLEADAQLAGAQINHVYVGEATAQARLNKAKKGVDIVGQVVENERTVASVTGLITPADHHSWKLDIVADSINLGFINHWTSNFLDSIAGRGYGQVQVFGADLETHVTARAWAQKASVGVAALGTRYAFSDSIIMTLNEIQFPHLSLHDNKGNPVSLHGKVTHNGQFQQFSYDIGIRCQHALVLDLPAGVSAFYGKVYGTGGATILGNEYECRISANARTDAGSVFNLALGNASTARDNSFITFVDHTPQKPEPTIRRRFKPRVKKQGPNTRLLIDLQIEATDDALANIIIDPRTQDRLTGRGQGNLKFSYDLSADDMKLFGTYTLNRGSFFFTFQNLIRKEFTLHSGSQVMFTGDATNPQVDATAHYSTTASLRDLFGSDLAQVSTNRTSVPVNCLLYLKDNLMNPTISFGIELPQSDESVASQVRSVVNTEEMMMRQILYLLVFNRFYTPEYLQTDTQNKGLNETLSLLSSTITGQLNNWVSKLTSDLSLGFNVRTDGVGSDASQEYEAQFQYQFNNRLLINGNFGYRYNDISNQPIFGNLDLEYLLSPSGHWRAKAYTHTVDKYSLREAQTMQGVGFTFKYDFGGQDPTNKKAKQGKQAPQDSTKVSAPNSTAVLDTVPQKVEIDTVPKIEEKVGGIVFQ